MRTLWLSLDPYMRGRMSAAKSYAKPVEVGATMVGGTVGEVVASRNPNFAVGDIAVGYGGWQDYAVASGSGLAIPPNLIRRPRQSWTIRLSGTAMPTCVTDAGVRLASECRAPFFGSLRSL